MTKKQQERKERLMPEGVPRYVRVYDYGDSSYDRYTVVYTGATVYKACGCYPYTSLTGQGAYFHGENAGCVVDTIDCKWPPKIGGKNHLGRRLAFEDLPEVCQEYVRKEYMEYWNIDQSENKGE